MSDRLTHSDVFGGILTNSEVYHFGGEHSGTEVAYGGEPIKKLFQIENMCYDKLGNEVISLARLRELADAERDGRVVVLPCKVGEPLFIVRNLCEHADQFGYCNVDYWYAKRGFKREDGCVSCPKQNIKPRVTENKFNLGMMGGQYKVFTDRAEAEHAIAATEPKGDAKT